MNYGYFALGMAVSLLMFVAGGTVFGDVAFGLIIAGIIFGIGLGMAFTRFFSPATHRREDDEQ